MEAPQIRVQFGSTDSTMEAGGLAGDAVSAFLIVVEENFEEK